MLDGARSAVNTLLAAQGHGFGARTAVMELRRKTWYLKPEDLRAGGDAMAAGSDKDAISMQGCMIKKNPRGVEWWKKRFFVLDGGKLSYFEEETAAEPKHVLELSEWEIDISERLNGETGKSNSIELRMKSDMYAERKRQKRHKEMENCYTLSVSEKDIDTSDFKLWKKALLAVEEQNRREGAQGADFDAAFT